MKTQLEKLAEITIFDNQPSFTKDDFNSLLDKGLIVPATFKKPVNFRVNTDKSGECEVPHRFPNDVISYVPLCNHLKDKGITQDDARRLIMVETIRSNGRPRASHFTVLIPRAFAEDKNKVFERIEKECRQKVR